MDRRTVLLALGGLAAGTAAAAAPLQIDPQGARRVGQAYLDAHPGQRFDAARLKADLLPKGWNAAAAHRLRARRPRFPRRPPVHPQGLAAVGHRGTAVRACGADA